MFKLKFVLVAILIFLGCVLSQSLQGDAVASAEIAEASLLEEVKEEAARYSFHEDEDNDRKRGRGGNNNNNNNNNLAFPPCQPPKGGVKPTSSPSTNAPATSAPTQKATSAPTQKATSAPTQKATSAPTQKATSAPTQKATNAPTQKATSAPTQKATSAPATQRPTQKATNAPTQKATSAPATQRPTQKATSAPATQRPTQKATAAPTQKATSAPVTQRPTQKATQPPSGGGSDYGLCDVVPTSVEPLKMLVPLYVYPGSTWDQLVSAASKVDIVAIINPSSGPGKGSDSTYNTYCNKLNNAGIEQVGYVYTQYGARSISTVKADIDIYKRSFPHVIGIFFDEASDKASDLAYYRELYNYVISIGYKHSILNPGVVPDAGYAAISTNIVVFEEAGSKSVGKSYASYVKCAPSASQKAGYKYKYSAIAHSTSSSSSAASYIQGFQNAGLGMVYVTDGASGCCTYNNMVSYLAAQATAIQSINN